MEIEGADSLYDVAVIATDDVWAFGPPRDLDQDDDWIGHWDGTRWSEVESPPPDWELVVPYAIAAVATDDVWLAGTDYGSSGNQPAPYIAHWDGTRWSRSEVGVRSGLLRDVSVFSADSVWAAGYASTDEFDQEIGSLVLRWDGKEWLHVPTPDGFDGPDNITATDNDEVWGVPDYFAGEPSPLWRWDGSTWTQEVPPMREISVMTALDGVLWAGGSRSRSVAVARLGESGWESASIEGVGSPDESGPFPGLVAVSETTAWGVGREPVVSRACIE